MKIKILFAVCLVVALALGITALAGAVAGAAFTTYNPSVDGVSKIVCKNSIINCNIYGAKEYVWLNGGPDANHLAPDGEYFFAVLEPGGQPNPNDQGGNPDKNLSDDFDLYTNRTFTISEGEVSSYTGDHWLDSNTQAPGGCKNGNGPQACDGPDGQPPYIRLFPYSDTTNPGGVYILAICSLEDGYPVEPRDCKYDAFKVKEGPASSSLYLSGMKFEDLYADGKEDWVDGYTDAGLSGWEITIVGTGFLGEPINVTETTDQGGFWNFQKDYSYTRTTDLVPAVLQVCEVMQKDWTQSYPDPSCYDLTIEPASLGQVTELDFGNWDPIKITACKYRDLDGVEGGDVVPVPGYTIYLFQEGIEEPIDVEVTGEDGCFTWTSLTYSKLTPGFTYRVEEALAKGWEVLGNEYYEFRAYSGQNDTFEFVNAVLEGCTPGFWQGGNDFGNAGGKWLWNTESDPHWVTSGGAGYNPYIWTDPFDSLFTPYDGANDMWYYLNPNEWAQADDNTFNQAARNLVAGYLNASWGMNYPYSTEDLIQMWTDFATSGDFGLLHSLLSTANESAVDTDGDGVPEHQCPISASIIEPSE